MPEEVTETTATTTEETAEVKNPKKKKGSLPKFLKNRYFIFTVSFILFFVSLLTLILIDETNTFRPKWADFVFNWLQGMGLTFNVTMFTWFVFFLIFAIFFAIFFITLFYKNGLKKRQEKSLAKTGEELSDKKIARYKFVFLFVTFTLTAAVLTAGIIFMIVSGYIHTVEEQLQDLPSQIVNFFTTLGMLLAFILVIPVTFAFLLLIFRFLIMVIALIAGNVQNTVMRSEAYQRNMAAVQATADELNSGRGHKGGKGGGSADGSGGSGGGNSEVSSPQADVIFPALTNIDHKWEQIIANGGVEAIKTPESEETPADDDMTAPVILDYGAARTTRGAIGEPRPPLDYEQFKLLAYEFQSYLCHNKYYFKINTLRYFIAGMAAARLLLLQGLSGTGKSTLPRVFLEYIGGDAYFFPVQATWRDRSDITGYYSDFTGQFKETELLKHLYEASYIPETCNLMVLDEMNISRVEYYFADFLSIFEYPAEDWLVPLIQVKPGTKLPKYIENGMVRIPVNTWFVGTVNIDDSTFTITDKVYDRAIAIDFNELNLPFESSYRFDPHPIKVQELQMMFRECKEKTENNLTPAERKKFLDLTKFISETFDIQFGNRIMNQIDNFLPVFVGLGGTKNEALDFMLARKVLRKLDGKFESYIKDGLNKLNRYLNSTYGKHAFPESEAAIERYRRKLS